MTALVQFENVGKVGVLTLNRPEKRNALNDEMVAALKSQLTAIQQDENIRVVVIKGAGEAFCAGADLAYLQKLQSNSFEENLADSRSLMALFSMILQYPKPVIAQVHGPAIAGGCGLASVCDISFASPQSQFAYTEVKIGFVPAIVMVFLQKKIGEAKARELLLSGSLIDAHYAKEIGLISFVTQNTDPQVECMAYAQKMAETNSAQSMQTVKEMLFSMPNNYSEALDYAAQKNAEARGTSDCKKGIAAFLNKEKIQW
jgi:methylglutaconyl-CoA hydratase